MTSIAQGCVAVLLKPLTYPRSVKINEMHVQKILQTAPHRRSKAIEAACIRSEVLPAVERACLRVLTGKAVGSGPSDRHMLSVRIYLCSTFYASARCERCRATCASVPYEIHSEKGSRAKDGADRVASGRCPMYRVAAHSSGVRAANWRETERLNRSGVLRAVLPLTHASAQTIFKYSPGRS